MGTRVPPSDGNRQSSEHSVVVLRVVDDWLASDGGEKQQLSTNWRPGNKGSRVNGHRSLSLLRN